MLQLRMETKAIHRRRARTMAALAPAVVPGTPLALRTLSDVAPAVAPSALLTAGIDFDSLWPNFTSENDPPPGAATDGPEFGDRYNAGGGAWAGSWVRKISSTISLTTVYRRLVGSCAPGQSFHLEAQAWRNSGSGSGKVRLGYWDASGSQLGSFTDSSTVTSAAWVLLSSDATAPANAVNFTADLVSTYSTTQTDIYFDSIYLRRKLAPELSVTNTISGLSPSTGWNTSGQGYKSGGMVVGGVTATVSNGATALWTSIFTVPADAYPPTAGTYWVGTVYNGTNTFAAHFKINSGGVASMDLYDNGTSMVAPFAIATGNIVQFSFAYPYGV